MKKVFCKDCKWLVNFIRCVHISNRSYNWYGSNLPKQSPSEINANNDCGNFEIGELSDQEIKKIDNHEILFE